VDWPVHEQGTPGQEATLALVALEHGGRMRRCFVLLQC